MQAHERLIAWVTHNGFKVEKRRGVEFIRVQRRNRCPMKIYLTLTRRGWIAAGDRKSHRCRPLERLVREFNEAEQWISGELSDRLDQQIRRHLDELPDPKVQGMADWYAAKGRLLTLADVRIKDCPNLTSLVMSNRYREAYMAEPARRDRAATAAPEDRRLSGSDPVDDFTSKLTGRMEISQ